MPSSMWIAKSYQLQHNISDQRRVLDMCRIIFMSIDTLHPGQSSLFKLKHNCTATHKQNKATPSWFQTFAVFWMLYAFFWVIPRRLNFIFRRFGTLRLYHLHRQVGMNITGIEKSNVKCIQYDVKHNLVLDGILVY